MTAALALALLLATPALPVHVDGDPAFASFVAARLLATGHTLVPADEAAVRVHIVAVDRPGDESEAGVGFGARVVVEDKLGPLVERTVDAADAGERRLAAWLVVQGAVERTGVERVDVAVPVATSGLAAGVLLAASPDVALGSNGYVPLGVHASARWRVVEGVNIVTDVGYVASLGSDTVLHGIPVRVGAEVFTDVGEGPVLAGGARASATPTWAAGDKRGALGVGGAVGVYGRVLAPLGGPVWGVVEAGVETRVLRQAILTDAGAREEALVVAPVAAGVEVRW